METWEINGKKNVINTWGILEEAIISKAIQRGIQWLIANSFLQPVADTNDNARFLGYISILSNISGWSFAGNNAESPGEHAATLLSLRMVLECSEGSLGDAEDRIPLWGHPKLTQLGHSMKVTILTGWWQWHFYPLTPVHSALDQD